MKLRTKFFAVASMLPIMANAYYMNNTVCASQSQYVAPNTSMNVIYSDGVNAPVIETVNYAPMPVYVPVQQPAQPVQQVPVSTYNTQQYYTPVVQTTVGFYR
jgi:hypothetical protein